MTDRNKEHMYKMWGTTKLATDYHCFEEKETKVLTEVLHDDKNRLILQNELHAKIRNDADYDDWEYGTEPIYEFTNK